MSDTPITDRILTDPIAVPPEIDVRLRRIERQAREARDRLRASAPGGASGCVELDRSLVDLESFLENEKESPLHRLSNRPLSQLEVGGPAWRSFERRSETLLKRAARALEIYPSLRALHRRTETMRPHYQPLLPQAWATELQRARLEPRDLASLRTAREVEAAAERLDVVRARLDDLLRLVPQPMRTVAEPAEDADGFATRQEVIANAERRLRERSVFAAATLPRERLHSVTERHLDVLAQGRRDAGPSSPAEVVVQHLANDAASLVAPMTAPVAGDVQVWAALLSAAERNRAVPVAWRPRRKGATTRDPAGVGENQFFAVPVGDQFVLLTRRVRSAVTVWSHGIAVGSTVQCRVFGREALDYRLASLDVEPLMQGLATEENGIWQHEQEARLRVLFKHGDDWYARLETPGRVRPVQQTPGTEIPPGALRVMRPAEATWSDRRISVTVTADAMNAFDITAATGTAAVPGEPTVLVRSGRNADRLEAEARFFRALARTVPGGGLHPFGPGRTTQGDDAWLYHPPMALPPSRQPAIDAWTSQHRSLAALELLRTAAAVWRTGHALIAWHWDAFRIGVVTGPNGDLRPRFVLAAAPLVTRFGNVSPPVPLGGSRKTPVFPRIRFRGLPPEFEARPTARPEVDAFALGCQLLDTLAKTQIPSDARWLDWTEMLQAVEESSAYFEHSRLAQRIAFWLAERLPERLVGLAGRIGEAAGQSPGGRPARRL